MGMQWSNHPTGFVANGLLLGYLVLLCSPHCIKYLASRSLIAGICSSMSNRRAFHNKELETSSAFQKPEVVGRGLASGRPASRRAYRQDIQDDSVTPPLLLRNRQEVW